MIVLDASALVDAVLDQSAAEWVLDQIADEDVSSPCAPAGGDALRTVPARPRGRDRARHPPATRSTRRPRCRNDSSFPTVAHLRRAYALRERIRVLDGLYVALADELGCSLVTTDRRLATATAPCDVRTPQA